MGAFDGPGPFEGDAVYNYVGDGRLTPRSLRETVASGLRHAAEGGATQQIPAEFLKMAGLTKPPVYLDVDDGVWGWACAELVGMALGIEPETPVPSRFSLAARNMPDAEALVADALKVLDMIVDPKRSEFAGLLAEGRMTQPIERIRRLREHLAKS